MKYGGEHDESTRYIAPTVMVGCTEDDAVMKEEIFGPILPIVLVKSSNDAIEFINRHDKPLALYVFATKNQVYEDFVERTSSGSCLLNDCLVQCASKTFY